MKNTKRTFDAIATDAADIKGGHHVSTRDLATTHGVLYGTINYSLYANLGLVKKSARWVPKGLYSCRILLLNGDFGLHHRPLKIKPCSITKWSPQGNSPCHQGKSQCQPDKTHAFAFFNSKVLIHMDMKSRSSPSMPTTPWWPWARSWHLSRWREKLVFFLLGQCTPSHCCSCQHLAYYRSFSDAAALRIQENSKSDISEASTEE